VEDGADRAFLSREEWAARPGEESSGCSVAARGKRRSRPLATKAIDEAVGERGFRQSRAKRLGKDRVAHSMSGWRTCRRNRLMGLPDEDAAFR
jgi:hypothetical protein